MKRYSSVEELLLGEKVSPRIVAKVRGLLDRDKEIAEEFRNGLSTKALARRYKLPLLVIEDILRYELELSSDLAGETL